VPPREYPQGIPQKDLWLLTKGTRDHHRLGFPAEGLTFIRFSTLLRSLSCSRLSLSSFMALRLFSRLHIRIISFILSIPIFVPHNYFLTPSVCSSRPTRSLCSLTCFFIPSYVALYPVQHMYLREQFMIPLNKITSSSSLYLTTL
jgi:hypothetical protein